MSYLRGTLPRLPDSCLGEFSEVNSAQHASHFFVFGAFGARWSSLTHPSANGPTVSRSGRGAAKDKRDDQRVSVPGVGHAFL